MNNSRVASFKLERQGRIVADMHQSLQSAKNREPQLAAAIDSLSVVADELVSNVLKYSDSNPNDLIFSFDIQASDHLLVCRLQDNGCFFDPFVTEEPDLTLPVADREIGGLGLLLVQSLTENGRYYRQEPWNVTEFNIPIESENE